MLAAAQEKRFDADTVRDLEVIDRQGGRIAEIMRSLLAYARKSEFRMTSVDLNGVVREVVSLVNKPFAKQGVLVETDLDAALPSLQASPDRLQQVFLNLLNNARDAMPQGGTITVRTARLDGHVLAEVSDTGPGLTAQAREHAFEPFFTTKEAGQGTGLGLWVSYGIVSAHGGELEALNAPAGGALFRLRLPLPVEAAA
jgi:signal transduction histidine kinase